MLLSDAQVTALAKVIASKADSIREFYENPDNQKKYKEWHLKKYGCLPEEQ